MGDRIGEAFFGLDRNAADKYRHGRQPSLQSKRRAKKAKGTDEINEQASLSLYPPDHHHRIDVARAAIGPDCVFDDGIFCSCRCWVFFGLGLVTGACNLRCGRFFWLASNDRCRDLDLGTNTVLELKSSKLKGPIIVQQEKGSWLVGWKGKWIKCEVDERGEGGGSEVIWKVMRGRRWISWQKTHSALYT